MIEVSAVPPELIDHAWPHVRDYIADAISYGEGRYSVESVKIELLMGREILLVAIEDKQIIGAVILKPSDYPCRRLMTVLHLGGERLEQWAGAMVELTERIARDMSCDGIEACGRPGWKLFAKNHGFRASHVYHVKDL